MAPVSGVASFHLVRHGSRFRAMASLGRDRRMLRRVAGLRFWRLLGTGAGARTGGGADLCRTALFAVWEDEAALDAFSAAMDERWRAATESWHVRLRAAGGHGTWRGFDVIAASGEATHSTHAVAVVTRAHVRVRALRRFRAAAEHVDAELAVADGLLAVVGVGEAPVSRLGTFSVWRDAASARAFSAGGPRHRDVVRRTRAESWYGEELFARFEPYASSGSWDGRDPLADTGTSMP